MKKFWEFLKAIWRWLLFLFAIRKKSKDSDSQDTPEQEESQEESQERESSESPITNMSRKPISEETKEEKKSTNLISSTKKKFQELAKKIVYSNKTDNIPIEEGDYIGVYYTYDVDNSRIIREDFYSIGSLVSCLEKRTNNSVMKDKQSSNRNEFTFFGTYSYQEAKLLLLNGWSDLLDRIKPTYNKNIKVLSYKYIRKKSTNINTMVGGLPNVPRTLMCLPNNLINREPSVKKINSIEIVYDISVDCSIEIREVVKSGIALLSAIRLLEQSGIQLKLTCCFFTSKSSSIGNSETVIGTVLLKDFAEKLNLLKVCFPLAHPSMIRRIGFKFLETIPGITKADFTFGYGSTVQLDDLRKIFQADNTVVLSCDLINKEMKFDVEKLIKYIEDNVKKQN